jgi:hypothetical protein
MEINWLAILISVVAAMAIGATWYSPLLFVKPWMKEAGLNDKKVAESNMTLIIGLNVLLTVITAVSLSMFIGKADWVFGAFAGFMAGATFVSTFTGTQYLYEQRSLKLFLITAGYSTLTMTVMGAIIGYF